MSEYNMSHTGTELDDAISKVKNGYILPSGTKDITSNGTHDVTAYASALVNVPVPDGYIDLSTASKFATGVVNDVTAGQKMTVTGITDDATGEAFDVKGVFAYIQFTENSWAYPANHANNIPAVFCFVRDDTRGFGTAIACGCNGTNLREVRFNTDIGGVSSDTNTYITFDADSFTYIAKTNSMYGLLAADQWRWVAWG